MWPGHVHDHSVWANLIAPQRLQARVKCELTWAKTLGRRDLVPFGDILVLFAQFLNSNLKFEAHRWPTNS